MHDEMFPDDLPRGDTAQSVEDATARMLVAVDANRPPTMSDPMQWLLFLATWPTPGMNRERVAAELGLHSVPRLLNRAARSNGALNTWFAQLLAAAQQRDGTTETAAGTTELDVRAEDAEELSRITAEVMEQMRPLQEETLLRWREVCARHIAERLDDRRLPGGEAVVDRAQWDTRLPALDLAMCLVDAIHAAGDSLGGAPFDEADD